MENKRFTHLLHNHNLAFMTSCVLMMMAGWEDKLPSSSIMSIWVMGVACFYAHMERARREERSNNSTKVD